MASNGKPSRCHLARSCGFRGNQHVFNVRVPGCHAGRSRAHVEHESLSINTTRATCARGEILPKPLRLQRFQHNTLKQNQTTLKTSSRALLRTHHGAKANTWGAGGRAGVRSPSRGASAAPRGRNEVPASSLPLLLLQWLLSSAPPWARRGGGHRNICSRALPNSSDSKFVSALLPRAHMASYVVGGRVGVGGAL